MKTLLKAGNTTPNTQLLFVGTYTGKESHVNGKGKGIYLYELDNITGKLTFLCVSPFTKNPSYVAPHPDGTWLYAVNEISSSTGKPAGTVSAFKIINNGKSLEFVNSVSAQGNAPCYLAVDKTGKFVMVANYMSGTVALFPIKTDGSLGEATSIDQHASREPSTCQRFAHAHMIIPSPDNRFVYSCDLGIDHIVKYKLDIEKKRLIPTGDDYISQNGAGPRHMVWYPLKEIAYVINELNGTIECMKIDTQSGLLTRFQIISTISTGNGNTASCADIHVTPSGKYLYATNRGEFNNIAMYVINQLQGELALIGYQEVKGRTPRSIIIDNTGTYLLVANQDSDNIITFRIDDSSGQLIDTGLETSVPTPACLKLSIS